VRDLSRPSPLRSGIPERLVEELVDAPDRARAVIPRAGVSRRRAVLVTEIGRLADALETGSRDR